MIGAPAPFSNQLRAREQFASLRLSMTTMMVEHLLVNKRDVQQFLCCRCCTTCIRSHPCLQTRAEHDTAPRYAVRLWRVSFPRRLVGLLKNARTHGVDSQGRLTYLKNASAPQSIVLPSMLVYHRDFLDVCVEAPICLVLIHTANGWGESPFCLLCIWLAKTQDISSLASQIITNARVRFLFQSQVHLRHAARRARSRGRDDELRRHFAQRCRVQLHWQAARVCANIRGACILLSPFQSSQSL